MKVRPEVIRSLSSVIFVAAAVAIASATPAATKSRLTESVQASSKERQEAALYKTLKPWDARTLWKARHRFRGYDKSGPELMYNSPIQHVVVIVMENRTVDNLFAGLYNYQFGQSPVTWGGQNGAYNIANPATLSPIDLNEWGSPGHAHYNFQGEANLTQGKPYNPNWGSDVPDCKGNTPCAKTVQAYVNPIPEPSNMNTQQILPYKQIAENFSSADNVYQANQGPSLVAHQYLIAAQSGGYYNNPQSAPSPASVPLAIADNNNSGCGQPSGPLSDEPWYSGDGTTQKCQSEQSDYCIPGTPESTAAVDMANTYFASNNEKYNKSKSSGGNGPIIPCENYNTILDLFSDGNLGLPPGTWEYHTHNYGSYWNALVLVSRFANCNGQTFSCQPVPSDIVDQEAYTFVNSEVPAQNLAALTYLIPCPADSDHPNSVSLTGPSWVSYIVNALGNPAYNLWQNTAVIVVYDDWGGWYDHLPPQFALNPIYPVPDANEWGYRVPLLVVSAYPPNGPSGLPGGFVSHIGRSSSAILHFIEDNFYIQGSGLSNLGSLGADDADNDDLRDLFNFQQAPVLWPKLTPTIPFQPLMQGNKPYCAKNPV